MDGEDPKAKLSDPLQLEIEALGRSDAGDIEFLHF